MCPYCQATKEKYFFQGQCRRCIHLEKNFDFPQKEAKSVKLNLPFALTSYQNKLSEDLWGEDDSLIFLEAVCGAGKTEVVLSRLAKELQAKKNCIWAVPRREIVLELAQRLQKYFPSLKVVPVCQGYTEDVFGDLIICTTHQLFRYHGWVDFMILDEPDAFPFKGNAFLQGLLRAALKENGTLLYLSATKDDSLKKKIDHGKLKHLSLSLRPSLELLPPIHWRLSLFSIVHFIRDFSRHVKDLNLVFVPSIAYGEKLSFFTRWPFVHSKSLNKDQIIDEFRQKSSGTLLCTTILERGVTFLNCNVFVLQADHQVFDEAALVQIAGRIRRGLNPEKGSCYFYSQSKDKEIQACIQNIKRHNHIAQHVLNR